MSTRQKNQKDYHKAYHQKNRAAGLCWTCKRPALEGYSRCEYHLEYNRIQKERYRKKNRKLLREKKKLEAEQRFKQGRCTSCGRVIDPEIDAEKTCTNCIQRLFFGKRRFYGIIDS